MYGRLFYSQVAHWYMCKIYQVFYGKSRVTKGGGRGGWSDNMAIFHRNSERKLPCYAKSKHHTDAILAITSTRIHEASLCATDINRMHVSKLIKIVHFLRKHNLRIKEPYPPLLHFLAFDLEELITKQYLELSRECNIKQPRQR